MLILINDILPIDNYKYLVNNVFLKKNLLSALRDKKAAACQLHTNLSISQTNYNHLKKFVSVCIRKIIERPNIHYTWFFYYC